MENGLLIIEGGRKLETEGEAGNGYRRVERVHACPCRRRVVGKSGRQYRGRGRSSE